MLHHNIFFAISVASFQLQQPFLVMIHPFSGLCCILPTFSKHPLPFAWFFLYNTKSIQSSTQSFSRHFHAFFRLPSWLIQGIFMVIFVVSSRHLFMESSQAYLNAGLHPTSILSLKRGIGDIQQYRPRPNLLCVQAKSYTCITSLSRATPCIIQGFK